MKWFSNFERLMLSVVGSVLGFFFWPNRFFRILIIVGVVLRVNISFAIVRVIDTVEAVAHKAVAQCCQAVVGVEWVLTIFLFHLIWYLKDLVSCL
jgi:uncharacterized membrane protein (DUF106 family)